MKNNTWRATTWRHQISTDLFHNPPLNIKVQWTIPVAAVDRQRSALNVRLAPKRDILQWHQCAKSRHRAQPILERSALLTAHAERKASLTPMGIYRDRPPMNAITARGQRFEAHPARIRYVGGTTGLRAGMVKRSVGFVVSQSPRRHQRVASRAPSGRGHWQSCD